LSSEQFEADRLHICFVSDHAIKGCQSGSHTRTDISVAASAGCRFGIFTEQKFQTMMQSVMVQFQQSMMEQIGSLSQHLYQSE
jgi:hypothetical protein